MFKTKRKLVPYISFSYNSVLTSLDKIIYQDEHELGIEYCHTSDDVDNYSIDYDDTEVIYKNMVGSCSSEFTALTFDTLNTSKKYLDYFFILQRMSLFGKCGENIPFYIASRNRCVERIDSFKTARRTKPLQEVRLENDANFDLDFAIVKLKTIIDRAHEHNRKI